MKTLRLLSIFLVVLGVAAMAEAVVIDFTGGTVYDGGMAIGNTTAANELYSPVDYYIENGFKLDFIGPAGDWTIVGDYYGPDNTGNWNDVIHGHWSTGSFGGMTAIEITKVGGGTFDLNYFILTSNTDSGGWWASGNEQTFIEAWSGGSMTYSQQLPSQDWGWDTTGPFPGVGGTGATQIFLGSAFDAVDMVRFTVGNNVDCFGMDEFYIDEDAPPPIPEPGTLLLLGVGLIGLAGARRKCRR